MKQFLENLKNKVFRLATNKVDIHQTDRNDLKREFLDALESVFPENVVTGREKQGIILELPNEELGAIVVVLNPVFKNANYDIKLHMEEFQIAEKKRLEKLAEQEKKRLEREQKQLKAKADKEKQQNKDSA